LPNPGISAKIGNSRPTGLERRATQTPADLEREIRERLTNWRAMLRRNVPQGRQMLRKLIQSPLRFEPVGTTWAFTGQAAIDKILAEFHDSEIAKSVASPTGTDGLYKVRAVEWFAA
jgi:hypothetical protein